MRRTLTLALIDRLGAVGVRVEPGEMLRIYAALSVGGGWSTARFENVVAAILGTSGEEEQRIREVLRAWLRSSGGDALWRGGEASPATTDDVPERPAEEATEDDDPGPVAELDEDAPRPSAQRVEVSTGDVFSATGPRVESTPSLFWLAAPETDEWLLFSQAERDRIVWGIRRHQIEQPSRRLHIQRTINATIERGGAPTLRWRPRRGLQPVSIWLDTATEGELGRRMAEELGRSLEAVGVPVQQLRYWQLPDRLKDARNRLLPPAELVERPGKTAVLLVTDGRGLRRRDPRAVQWTLRALSRWGYVAAVHAGPLRQRGELEGRLAPYAIPCLDPRELPTWLGSAGAERSARAWGGYGPTWMWAAACALLPMAVDDVDALALLKRLQLPVSPFAVALLRDNSVSAAGIQFTRAQNGRLLDRAQAAFAHAPEEHPGFLQAAARYWMARVVDGALPGWRQDRTGVGISRRLLYAAVQLHVERSEALEELAALVETPQFAELAEHLTRLRPVDGREAGIDLPFAVGALSAEEQISWSRLAPRGKPDADEEALQEGEPLRLEGHPRAINAAIWSPDGARVYTASDDGTVRAWDAKTGAALWSVEQGSRVRALTAHPRSGVIYSGNGRGVVCRIDPETGASVKLRALQRTATVWELACDGDLLMLVGNDGHLVIAEREEVVFDQAMSDGKLYGVAIGSEKEAAYCGADGVVGILDGPSGSIGSTGSASPDVWTICWSEDGQALLAGTVEGMIERWSGPGRAQQMGKLSKAGISSLEALDGGRLLAATADGWVLLARYEDDRVRLEAQLKASRSGVLWAERAPGSDGRVVTGDTRGGLAIWPASAFTYVESEAAIQVSVLYGDLAHARWPVVAGCEGFVRPGSALETLDRTLGGKISQLADSGVLPSRLGTHLPVSTSSGERLGALLIGVRSDDYVTRNELDRALKTAFSSYLRAWRGANAAGISCLLVGAEHDFGVEVIVARILLAALAANASSVSAGGAALKAVEFIQRYEDRATQILEASRRFGRGVMGIVVPEAVEVAPGGAGAAPLEAAEADRLEIRFDRGSRALEFALQAPGAEELERARHGVDSERLLKLIKRATKSTGSHAGLREELFGVALPMGIRKRWRRTAPLRITTRGGAAGVPWELLDDGAGEPLVTRAVVTRQLAPVARSKPFVGNARALILADLEEAAPLPGAREEAEALVTLFDEAGWQTEAVIGHQHTAIDVRARLTPPMPRVLHIAAKGLRLQPEPGGSTPVIVLPGGYSEGGRPLRVLTPADLSQLDPMPEVVVLNTCNTGRLADQSVLGSYSYREDMVAALFGAGARAVVALGWMVNDRAATTFGLTFWRAMLSGKTLGEAALQARRACWQQNPDSNLFAAYQVYGDARLRVVEEPASGELPTDASLGLPLTLQSGEPFIDRATFKALLLRLREPNGRNCLVVDGPPNSGKSYLGRYCVGLRRVWPEMRIAIVDSVDFAYSASISSEDIARDLAAQLNIDEEPPSRGAELPTRYSRRLVNWLLRAVSAQSAPALVVVDGLDAANLSLEILNFFQEIIRRVDEGRAWERFWLVFLGGADALDSRSRLSVYHYTLEEIGESDVLAWLRERFPRSTDQECALLAKEIIEQAPSGSARLAVINRLLMKASAALEEALS